MNLLERISSPDDLKKLSVSELHDLACLLRDFIIHSVSQTGGHLSSSLGVIELTIALHNVFNTPDDVIIWDVGHQCYAHKILTGRREDMKNLRQWGGISGFPKRDESVYDNFGTAHASTSISAALGFAIAAQRQGKDSHSIAVIGDGAITGGMAFEAMNNVSMHKDLRLLVILNDNEMSISESVGALNHYFARLISGQFYATAKDVGKSVLKGPLLELARKVENQAKNLVSPTTLFEEFGFNYIGPIDGHDLNTLLETLKNLKDRTGPQFLHIVTKKGHGYKLAEADPIAYHGLGPFSPKDGIKKPSKPCFASYSQIFGSWACDMAKKDSRFMAITPAMREGSGLVEFSKKFPNQYFDVSIAEQHALTLAAGLACGQLKPVVAIYSTFLQRAYDQLIHDIALQNLDVTLAIDRAGLVGADGATHHGYYDLAFMRIIPNLVIMAPSNENEARQMLSSAYWYNGPAAVRYPRGRGTGVEVTNNFDTLEIGKGEVLRTGKKIAILAFGALVSVAQKAAEELNITVVNMRFIKPLDHDLIEQLAQTHEAFVTIEEGVITGGAGSAVSEYLASKSIIMPILHLGLPDQFIDHGDTNQLLSMHNLDKHGIIMSIRNRFKELIE